MRMRLGSTIQSFPCGDSVSSADTTCRSRVFIRFRLGRGCRSTMSPKYWAGGYRRIWAKSSSAVMRHLDSLRHTSASSSSRRALQALVADCRHVVSRDYEQLLELGREVLVQLEGAHQELSLMGSTRSRVSSAANSRQALTSSRVRPG